MKRTERGSELQIRVHPRKSAVRYLVGLLVLTFFCPSPLRGGASLCGGAGAGGCADVTPWGSRSLLLVP